MLADGIEFAGGFDVQPDAFFASGRLPLRAEALGLLDHTWRLAGPEDAK